MSVCLSVVDWEIEIFTAFHLPAVTMTTTQREELPVSRKNTRTYWLTHPHAHTPLPDNLDIESGREMYIDDSSLRPRKVLITSYRSTVIFPAV